MTKQPRGRRKPSYSESEVFDNVWRVLERHSMVDSRGGQQYRRVKAEWLAPTGIVKLCMVFIADHCLDRPGGAPVPSSTSRNVTHGGTDHA